MVDRVTREVRRRTMQAVHGADTGPELALRRVLYGYGLRGYRVHCRALPGRPDIAFTRKRVAIFVDGCFWHGCRRCYRAPKSNMSYWQPKISGNRERDRRVNRRLRKDGWVVIRVWEHAVSRRSEEVALKIVQRLVQVGGDRRE